MKKVKRVTKAFSAWDYQKEIDFLNKQSESGWQMFWAGAFSSKYEKDDTIVFRYQLDFNPKVANHLEYVEYFRDQGWEYICSTFNGWHYFRKPYDSTKAEEEYEIYTDIPSKKEMSNRLVKILFPIAILEGLVFLMNIFHLIFKPELRNLVGIIVFGTITAFLIRGILLMSKSFDTTKGRKKTNVIGWIVAIFILVFLQPFIINQKTQINVTSDFNMGINNARDVISFNTKLPDIYYFTGKIDSDLPAHLNIVNSQGVILYRFENDFEERRLFLQRGDYKVIVGVNKNKVEEDPYIRLELSLD
ncbi:MAG: DUF2812 domain-containing protein [Clostridiales bacterium]|nr:DUF2812 domain-containing protein [Clostridiales bacterium]